MKTTKQKLIGIIFYGFLILGFMQFLSSCKKEERMIVGTWRVNKIEKKTGNGVWEDDASDCNIGSVEEYDKSGTWTYYPAPGSPCSGSTGMPSYGSYRFTASNTKLMFTYDDTYGEYDKSVESITKTTMVLSHNAGTTDNLQFRYTFSKE